VVVADTRAKFIAKHEGLNLQQDEYGEEHELKGHQGVQRTAVLCRHFASGNLNDESHDEYVVDEGYNHPQGAKNQVPQQQPLFPLHGTEVSSKDDDPTQEAKPKYPSVRIQNSRIHQTQDLTGQADQHHEADGFLKLVGFIGCVIEHGLFLRRAITAIETHGDDDVVER